MPSERKRAEEFVNYIDVIVKYTTGLMNEIKNTKKELDDIMSSDNKAAHLASLAISVARGGKTLHGY